MEDKSWEPVGPKTVVSNLGVYGFSHAVVDAACVATVLSLSQVLDLGSGGFVTLVLSYGVLAFGLQVPFGVIVDRWRVPVFSAILGCVLTAVSTAVFVSSPILLVCLAGVGNALFHIGGGTVSLNLTPKRATAPGIFVAPGALGVLIGTLISSNSHFPIWSFALLLLGLCVVLFVTKVPKIDYDHKVDQPSRRTDPRFFELVILLLLSSIAIRSLVGSTIVFPWKTDLTLLVILTGAVVLGKALGGVVADKSGWMRVGVLTLLLSAPLLAFGANVPYAAMLGMLMFNVTMPVTLTAISNMLPGRPGFAFGLTCLALVAGALPAFTEFKNVFANQWLILRVIVFSIGAFFLGMLLHLKGFSLGKGQVYRMRR
jgi:FSR family fosmidomycin resistance protein-like MFS transporter